MKKSTTLLLLLLLTINSYADGLSNNINIYDEFLKKVVIDYKVPGLSVAIFTDEGISYNAAYGTLKSGKEINIDTSFFLGSTSKTITALGIMLLADEGKIDIKDSVIKYLPEFSFNDDTVSPGAASVITIENLLNHTSGISDSGIPGNSMGETSIEEELLRFKKAKLVYPPGSQHKYCNLNYRLLGLIIQRISGKDFGTYIDEKIFNPLSMNHSYSDPNKAITLAEGHGQLFGFPVMRDQNFYPGALPSGSLISSVSDISKLLIDELRSFNGKKSVLPKDIVELTWKKPDGIESDYAKGWLVINKDSNKPFLIHGGALENYQSFFYLNPSANIGFVFMMNQGGFFPMTGAFNIIRDGLINMVNDKSYDYSNKNKLLSITVILTVIIILWQLAQIIITCLRKKHLVSKIAWKKYISIGLNIFWIIFFLFLFVPIMNTIMGSKGSFIMIRSMFPELFLIIISIIISNFTRVLLKLIMVIKI